MANNVVELIIDLKLEGKKDLAKYSKELKALSKILTTIEKQNKAQADSIKKLNAEQKESVKQSDKQVASNKRLATSQSKLAAENKKVLKTINDQTSANKDLNSSLAGLISGTNKAGEGGQKLSGSFSSTKLSKFGGTIGIVTGVLGGLAAAATATAGAISSMVLNSAKSQKELQIFARQANLTQIDLEALAFATEQYGITTEQIADISKDVYDKLGDYVTAASGPFQDFADVVGLTKEQSRELAREFQNLTSPEIITKMVSQMEAAGASGAQMTFVLESMGNDLSRLAPLFKNNAEELKILEKTYKDINEQLTLTEEQTKNLTEVSVNFDLFTKSMQKSTAVISSELAPALADFFGTLAKNIPGITKELEAFIHSFREIENMTNFKTLNDESKDARTNISELSKELEKQQKILEEQQNNPRSGYNSQYTNEVRTLSRISQLQAEIADEKDRLERTESRIKELRLEEAKANKESLKIEKEKTKESEKQAGGSNGSQGTAGAVDELIALQNRFKTEEQLLKEQYDRDVKLAGDNEKLKNDILNKYFVDLQKIQADIREDALRKEQNDIKESFNKTLSELENVELKFNAEIIGKEELETEALKIQEKLYSDIDKLNITSIEKQNQKLKIQEQINNLLKEEQESVKNLADEKELELRNAIELARTQGDKTAQINAELQLKNYLVSIDESLTENLKIQQQGQNELIANQKLLNEEKKNQEKIDKEIAKQIEKQYQAEQAALKNIQQLRFELLEIQGKGGTEEGLEFQREQAISEINADDLVSDDTKKIQTDLINAIFDEKVIDAEFEKLFNRYQELLIQLANATPAEAEGITNQISGLFGDLSNMEGLDTQQMLQLTDATNEWNNSLKNVEITMQDLATTINDSFNSAFSSFLDGTKSGSEAFRDFANSIISSLLDISTQAFTNQLLGQTAGGSFTGGGLFGAFNDLFSGFTLPFFHQEGSPSDPMLDTRQVKGLNADEMLSVVNKNEKVIHKNTYNDMKANGVGQSVNLTNNLVLDPSDLQKSIGKTDEFNQNIISVISANARQIKDIIS